MAKTRKIDVNAAAASPLINTAFAALSGVGLPEGPAEAPRPITKPKLKLGRVVLRKETAHRGGKTVIVAYDFAPHLPLSFLEELGRKLKTACGTGGTVRDRTIEIQGEQTARIRALLEAEGFQVAGIR